MASHAHGGPGLGLEGRKGIILTIGKDGSVDIEPRGVTGDECTRMTAALESKLGAVKNRTFKDEYHETTTEAEKVTV